MNNQEEIMALAERDGVKILDPQWMRKEAREIWEKQPDCLYFNIGFKAWINPNNRHVEVEQIFKNYTESRDALSPVLAKLTEGEWRTMLDTLWLSATQDKPAWEMSVIRTKDGLPENLNSFAKYVLTLPPDKLSHAVAEAIVACRSTPKGDSITDDTAAIQAIVSGGKWCDQESQSLHERLEKLAQKWDFSQTSDKDGYTRIALDHCAQELREAMRAGQKE